MPYTPVELRHVHPPRALFRGYRRDAIDSLLEEVVASFEEVWRQRGELEDQVELLQKQLDDLRLREQLLATTLVSAEKAATEAKEQAKREAELIVAEAHGEARSIRRAAQGERERLFAEARRVETLLRAALGIVQETDSTAPQDADAEDAERPQSWPAREDTREFGRANLVVAAEHEAQQEAQAG
jgi:cell division initiation protein